MKKTEKAVVYQAPNKLDGFFISRYLKKDIPVSIIEPFLIHNCKKESGGGVFLPDLPPYIHKLIQCGKISLLSAEEINAKEIYLLSGEKAVAAVEAVYPEYREKNKNIIQYVSETLKSSVSENVFKINLCNRLAEFYSVNIMLHRIERHFNSRPIVAYPDMNVYNYLLIKKLLLENNQDFFEHPNIRFPIQTYVASFLISLKENLVSMAKLCAQTIASGLLEKQHFYAKKKKKNFSYAVSIISPRQLRKDSKAADFFIDNQKILQQDVVYFPMMSLSKIQKKKLAQMAGEIFSLPQRGKFFSNFHEWKTLLLLALKQNFFRNAEEIYAASVIFSHYFKWKKVLENVGVKHFITHADFGMGHIGRNIALNQVGVQTWYFTDSMAYGLNFREEKKVGMRHPLFLVYLYYDHLVTWYAEFAQYCKEHPGSFKQAHIVGCIWGDHIREKNQAREHTTMAALKNLDNLFVLSCFDSTYLRNGHISYSGGIAFATHLLQLVDECPDIYVIFKEKKERSIHHRLDPVLGPKLLEIYNKMGSHPRIKICSNQVDASELMSVSDMVISFPFTSTTFEALSRNKPAIWHDPLGHYKETLYGKAGGVMTHSYEKLKAKVLEIKKNPEDYKNPLPVNSSLMDPYRDGKAIDRFRDLLMSE